MAEWVRYQWSRNCEQQRQVDGRLHGTYSPWKRSVTLRKCALILDKIIPFYTLMNCLNLIADF